MTRYRVQGWRKTPIYVIIEADSVEDAVAAAELEYEENGAVQFSEGEAEAPEFDPEETTEIDDHALVVAIQEILSGKVWTPDRLQEVADVLQEAGYVLKEVEGETVPDETAA